MDFFVFKVLFLPFFYKLTVWRILIFATELKRVLQIKIFTNAPNVETTFAKLAPLFGKEFAPIVLVNFIGLVKALCASDKELVTRS